VARAHTRVAMCTEPLRLAPPLDVQKFRRESVQLSLQTVMVCPRWEFVYEQGLLRRTHTRCT